MGKTFININKKKHHIKTKLQLRVSTNDF